MFTTTLMRSSFLRSSYASQQSLNKIVKIQMLLFETGFFGYLGGGAKGHSAFAWISSQPLLEMDGQGTKAAIGHCRYYRQGR